MSDFNTINLEDAALFSALAYAPVSANAMTYGYTQGTVNGDSDVNYQATRDLIGGGWVDDTQSLISAYNTAAGHEESLIAFHDATNLNEFRVFVNSTTHQVVFAFKGSSLNANNWVSDITTADQGYSQYKSIWSDAQALYDSMTAADSQYSTYQFVADGHSLGGGMAQTFALQNNISGFGQNALPIAPNSQTDTSFFPGGFSGYSNALIAYGSTGATFQELNLQGDIATAAYHTYFSGGYYLDSNLTKWLFNPIVPSTVNLLLGALGLPPALSPTRNAWVGDEAALIANAGTAHTLAALIPAALQQIQNGGVGFAGATPDSSQQQQSVANIVTPVLGAINGSGIQAHPDGSITLPIQLFGVPVTLGISAGGHVYVGPSSDVEAYVSGQFGLNVATGSATQSTVLTGTTGPTGTDVFIGAGAPTQMFGGSGPDVFVGGTGNTSLYGGTGSNTYLYENESLTSNNLETIVDPRATDALFVGETQISGTSTAGSNNLWTDANGTQYQFTAGDGFNGSGLGTLSISQGLLGANNGDQIIIQNFNLTDAQSATGEMGIFLPGNLTLNATANSGTTAPVPSFLQGDSQSYTVSVDAPSDSAQTVTIALSGAPAYNFDAVVGATVVALNPNGTFSVTLPAGAMNVSFELQNIAGFAPSAILSLSASIANPIDTAGSAINATPLAINYVGAPSTAPVASTLYGFNGSPGYFADYPADVTLELSHNAALQGDTVAAGSPSGDAFVWVQNANTSVVAAGNDDTILGEFGWPYGAGGTDIIVATGQHDVIENDSGLGNTSGPVGIYASGFESLSTAIALSQTGTGTGLQGDLIVGSSEANTTIVGSNGNDLITNASGNDIVVAGAGNDVIIGGVKSLYDFRYWGELGDDPLLAPSAATLEDFGWRATVTNGSLDIDGGLIDVGDYPGADPDPETPSTYVAAPANYEGNYDYYGNILGLGNETIYGGSGASLILLSNGNNYVDMGTGASTVRGGMGDNTVIGGSGSQLIVGGGGSDYLTGGTGNSTIAGNGGDNTIIGGTGVVELEAGGGGADFATAETGDNYVYGGSGSGTIFGSGGMDTLIGGTGNYTIVGGAGSELITGGSGTDLLLGGVGNDTIAAGGAGNDSLQANGSASSTTYLYGGDGSDSINGGSGANIIYAGDGGVAGAATTVFASFSDATSTTTIYGGLGVDQLTGGPGTAVIYAGDGAAVAQRCTDASRRIL